MTAEEFIPKNENGKYSRNEIVTWAEMYHETKLKNLSIIDGLPCNCGNKIFTHRHSNWIECTECNKIQILQS